MIDSLESRLARSSGELWSEICSGLPAPEGEGVFADSFQPQQASLSDSSSGVLNSSPWAPMADSEVYLASLENRLRRIKGQSQEVTSRDMLRTLSQAKKECWERFLQETSESELFMDGSEVDHSAVDQLRCWLQPEKVAISAEELQALLQPKRGGTEEGESSGERREEEGETESPGAEK
ncbi:coiled-coil domain-containing protein 32-like [Huso huso]|uniref:Coiled-coil domain-containing protein 32-like n=1 Tax=Huso huso TaxID=61971 RepID=A0ABR0Z9R1_HUSHU